MEQYHKILDKLSHFTRKYYTRQLIKGTLLFLTLGLLFWMAVTALEYFLWLSSSWRLTLFVTFLIAVLLLLYQFILLPLAYLFRLKKGLSPEIASRLIGVHFPQIADKLVNLLELSKSNEQSELVMASIAQRAQQLAPIPFSRAIRYKESYKYAKYTLLPLILLAVIGLSGYSKAFFSSHTRVMQYNTPFVRPAPFAFKILNDSLEVLDTSPLTLKVLVTGEIQPENVSIVIDGDTLLLKEQNGLYNYTFEAPVPQMPFYLTANGWDSPEYTIQRHKTPILADLKIQLAFPRYLKRKSKTITGTGNAMIPEGTRITWRIEGKNVERLTLSTRDTSLLFQRHIDTFVHTERLFRDFPYTLSTSNPYATHFETLHYTLQVVKDQNPTVQVTQILDSLHPNQSFYTGQAADDYSLSEIRLVCYPSDNPQAVQRLVLASPRTPSHQFYYTFPSGLQLETGQRYKLYFEIVDNDGLRQGKITRSPIFNTTVYDDNQLKNKELELQNTILTKLDQSLDRYKAQKEALSQINRKQKEASTLTFEDKNQIKSFLQKQEQQEKLMEKFSSQLKESLSKSQTDSDLRKMLQERLERQEREAQKNKKLLEELNKLTGKIDKEALTERLESLGKKQEQGTRNLEQLLALTQRYYVTEKMAQLSRDLENLPQKQEKLSKDSLHQNPTKAQQQLNREFEQLSKALDNLRKENHTFQKPIPFTVTKPQQQAITQDQQQALEALDQTSGKNKEDDADTQKKATRKQKAAAQKMQAMSRALQQSFKSSAASDTEDATMLRQILDNLVAFSFAQEDLLDVVGDTELTSFTDLLRDQKELRRLFEHVDDSLFVLSLRRAEISEIVNTQITEVYYNLDKALENIAENRIYRGTSHQQYTLNATNTLADFLARVLDNLQQKMQSGKGQGSDLEFQLPDIIQGQQDLQGKMKSFGKNGKKQQGKTPQKDGDIPVKQGLKRQKNNTKTSGTTEYNEKELQELYEIYKQQQYLREQLEKQLENIIDRSDRNVAKQLLQQMEDVENDLLQNRVTQRTQDKVNTIQHQLLRLENATLQQGEKKERKSSSSQNNFTNPITTKPELLKTYPNILEPLNQQALPLQPAYQQRVKEYFKND